VYNVADTIIANVHQVITELRELGYHFEIILVDDCSTDNTLEVISNMDNKHVRYLAHTTNAGKGRAFMSGFAVADNEYVVLMDSDIHIGPAELPVFFNIMRFYNADVVIGNKRHPYSIVGYTPYRWVVSNVYNYIVRRLFGVDLRDTQCGLKLFKRGALTKVVRKILVKRYAFDIELIVAMREKGIRIADAPVYKVEQLNLGSATVGNILQTLKDTLAVWWRKQKGWYR